MSRDFSASITIQLLQESLPNTTMIEKEVHQLTVVNDLLANLDIAVGFLMSMPRDPNELLVEFMRDVLKMKQLRSLADTVFEHLITYNCSSIQQFALVQLQLLVQRKHTQRIQLLSV